MLSLTNKAVSGTGQTFAESRRTFLKTGCLLLLTPQMARVARPAESVVRFGLLTDIHYADKSPRGSRYYRESYLKLIQTAANWEEEHLDFVVELGDFVDAADSVADELEYLETINGLYATLHGDRHYVLGNHCVDTLTKDEFLNQVGKAASYYSFDRQGFHFVVLDACFRTDGEPYGRKNFVWTDTFIPVEQLAWLQSDLAASQGPVVVFVHQRLDRHDDYGIENAADVRSILEASGRVVAVFQGHSHENDLNLISGIPYCTLVAMVEGSGIESSGSAIAELHSGGMLSVHAFGRQSAYRWE